MNIRGKHENLGSHGYEYDDCSLLGCDAVYWQTGRPTNVYIINKINCDSDYSTRDQNYTNMGYSQYDYDIIEQAKLHKGQNFGFEFITSAVCCRNV
jgi:hypothetical protein